VRSDITLREDIIPIAVATVLVREVEGRRGEVGTEEERTRRRRELDSQADLIPYAPVNRYNDDVDYIAWV